VFPSRRTLPGGRAFDIGDRVTNSVSDHLGAINLLF